MKITNVPQDIRDLKRLEQLLNLLFRYELAFFVHKLRLKSFLPLSKRLQQEAFQKRETNPEHIRKIMESMGGAFVKLGQLLSLRPDLIPTEYCNEFRKLQDSVKPFPYAEAQRVVESELKKPLKEMFLSFSDKPLAAASIGQVHEAALPDGSKVAVKVQRPGIRKTIETDIDLMRRFAELIEHYLKPAVFSPVEIVREFEAYTQNELDYIKEAKNTDRFSEHFSKDRTIRIPKIYWDHTSDKVLTMEFIRGTKCNDADAVKKEGFSSKIIVRNVVNAVFTQVFVNGFFHGDPHPGNILVLKQNRIAFLDFGIVGCLSQETKERAARLFVSMVMGDITGTAEGMIRMGLVGPSTDMESLERRLEEKLSKYYDVSVSHINLASLFSEIISLARESRMKVPSDFILLGKTIVTVQGFAVSLDPDFNLVKASKPFVKKMMKDRMSPKHILKHIAKSTTELSTFISNMPRQAAELLARIEDADRTAASIDTDIKALRWEMDKSSNRMTIGLITAAVLISSALLAATGTGQGSSLRHAALFGFTLAAFLLLFLVISIIREKRVL